MTSPPVPEPPPGREDYTAFMEVRGHLGLARREEVHAHYVLRPQGLLGRGFCYYPPHAHPQRAGDVLQATWLLRD